MNQESSAPDTDRDTERKDTEREDAERDETRAEREDRKYADLLQELRVIQTSAQLTAGFLLTLPFQQRFSDLTTGQERFYLVLVALAALVTAVVLSPVATHRQLSGRKVKGVLVKAAHTFVSIAIVLLALLATGIVVFIFDVIVDLTTSLVVGAGLLALLTVLMLVLPRVLLARYDRADADQAAR
ncbi:DUF6328 family protein [Nocardioides halotolerans]|jgi:hypothetical protein|uniref:DUF6328 family protein n=1 Tax=Nocardioides halotolerans TaxID=433660 RepID=UPI00041E555E|nr:DUF6328 family protein [Nocardioides halotolerans]